MSPMNEARQITRTRLLLNFLLMTVCFSVNHGAVTSVLSLAVPLLGPTAGPYSSGTLYICYAATALFLSTPLLSFLGTRNALITGTALYCVYVASFPLGLFVLHGHDDWCTKENPVSNNGSLVPSNPNCADPNNGSLVLVAIVGGVIGGFAAGFLWSAQGAYFAATAKLYAAASRVAAVDGGASIDVDETDDVTKATSLLSSIFACIFLSCEVLLKLLAFALKFSSVGNMFVAVAYSAAALASVAGLFFVMDLDKNGPLQRLIQRCRAKRAAAAAANAGGPADSLLAASEATTTMMKSDDEESLPLAVAARDHGEDNDEDSCGKPCLRAFFGKAASSVMLWFKAPRVLLLNPIQITFGVCAALLGYLVSGRAIGAAFKTNAVEVVGLMSAGTAATAALLQVPFAFVARKLGKPPLMLFGLGAFVVLATICLAATVEQLGTWGFIIPCYLLQGIGRASYEGTNRAVYADSFPNDAPAAFANIVLANGVASAAAYFAFPHMPPAAMASIALVSALVAIVCYIASFVFCGPKRCVGRVV